MSDQANELRRLVSHAAAAASDQDRPRAGLVTVAGGKGGVGTTTIAVNLAVEIARRGRSTLLLDADPEGGDVAVYCGLEDRHTLADVAAGRRSAAAAVQEGPGGVQILAGAWAVDSLADLPPAEQARLADQLVALADRYEVVVADAGNGRSGLARRLWQAAAEIVVVSTAELAAVMDAYGSIKVFSRRGADTRIHTLVNMAPGAPSAGNVERRLTQACDRFLGIDVLGLGHLEEDPRVVESICSQRPLVLEAPRAAWARKIRRVAARIGSRWPRPQAGRAGPGSPNKTNALPADPTPQGDASQPIIEPPTRRAG